MFVSHLSLGPLLFACGPKETAQSSEPAPNCRPLGPEINRLQWAASSGPKDELRAATRRPDTSPTRRRPARPARPSRASPPSRSAAPPPQSWAAHFLPRASACHKAAGSPPASPASSGRPASSLLAGGARQLAQLGGPHTLAGGIWRQWAPVRQVRAGKLGAYIGEQWPQTVCGRPAGLCSAAASLGATHKAGWPPARPQKPLTYRHQQRRLALAGALD